MPGGHVARRSRAQGGATAPAHGRSVPSSAAVARHRDRAVFVAGFSAFAVLYVAQGALPAVSSAFSVTPAVAALTVSLTTLPLALGVVVAASVSERVGRRWVLLGSLVAASLCTLATAASPSFAVLLGLRVATGLALAGLPAVAMAYVAEEAAVGRLGSSMGLYISGTGLGGLTGRLIGGLLSGTGWQAGYLGVGVMASVGTLYVVRTLPASRHFSAHSEGLLTQLRASRVHWRDTVLLRLFLCGFALMGAMVAYFNFLLYRLERAPFGLTERTAALVFLLYLAGTVSANYFGRMADHRSRRALLLAGAATMLAGTLLSLTSALWLVLLSTGLVTFGFFGAHATASGWVGAQSTVRRAQASSFYLLCYHLGSSILGFLGGLAYGGAGWAGLVLLVSASIGVVLLACAGLPATLVRGPAATATRPTRSQTSIGGQ
jgi:YNFM family putative membrane transporter